MKIIKILLVTLGFLCVAGAAFGFLKSGKDPQPNAACKEVNRRMEKIAEFTQKAEAESNLSLKNDLLAQREGEIEIMKIWEKSCNNIENDKERRSNIIKVISAAALFLGIVFLLPGFLLRQKKMS